MIYLISVLMFGLVWLILFVRHRELRRCSLVSGLLFSPAGLTQALFVPGYWNPEVVFRIMGHFDLESLLFAFFTGGIASILYPACFNLKPASVPGTRNAVTKHLFWILPALGAILLIGSASQSGAGIIYIALAVFAIGIIHMLSVRPDLWFASLWGALLFCALYSIIAFCIVRIFPDFINTAWNRACLFKMDFLGVPLEEYLYAALFGGLWSTVYCGLFNYRFVRKTHTHR